jgi:hypothetical protein
MRIKKINAHFSHLVKKVLKAKAKKEWFKKWINAYHQLIF